VCRAYRLSKLTCVGLIVLSFSLIPHPVGAQAAVSFDWGSFDSGGSTTYGVYEADNTTVLQTWDLVQLIWTGADGTIDPPQPDGSTTDDDQILDSSTVRNDLPGDPANKGYIPLKTYTFFPSDPQSGGTVYIRAWNASTASSATAYGDSTTATLTGGGTFNAPRWKMTHTPSVVTLVTFRAASGMAGWSNQDELGMLVVAEIGLLVIFGHLRRRYAASPGAEPPGQFN